MPNFTSRISGVLKNKIIRYNDQFQNLFNYNSAYKKIKKAQNRALKFEKHAKTMKNFFEIFLLELWRKHFWESWNSSASSDSSFVEIVFKLIFSPEDEIAKLFEIQNTNAFTYSLVTVFTFENKICSRINFFWKN